MIVAGITLLTLGTVGITSSVILEWRMKAKKWDISMKISALIFGAGGIIFGIAMAQGG